MEKMTYVDALNSAIKCAVLTDDVREKLTALKAQLEKRSASASSAERKPSKTQIANQGLKTEILTAMADGVAYTISDMVAQFECCNGLSGQKVSAVVRQLKMDGSVAREDVKGKAYFSKVA